MVGDVLASDLQAAGSEAPLMVHPTGNLRAVRPELLYRAAYELRERRREIDRQREELSVARCGIGRLEVERRALQHEVRRLKNRIRELLVGGPLIELDDSICEALGPVAGELVIHDEIEAPPSQLQDPDPEC